MATFAKKICFGLGVLAGFCCAIELVVKGDDPQFQIALSPGAGGGELSWPTVSNGYYQVETSTEPDNGWSVYLMTGAVFSASSTQLNLAIPTSDQQRYFRVSYLGTNLVTTNIGPVSINVSREFRRASESIDPMTGEVAPTNTPNVRTVKVPVWPAGRGLRRVSGTNFIVGVSQSGMLFGTPNTPGQTALLVSTDEGATWAWRSTLPKISSEENILRIISVASGTNELLFASTQQGGLYLSSDQGLTFSTNLIPVSFRILGVRAPFHDNLLVEAVAGSSPDDCHVLTCLYGQPLFGNNRMGDLYVFRSDLTLGQMSVGATPQLQLAWKQDFFDFYARHVAGAVAVTNRVGTVSATTNTISDSAALFGTNDITRPRCVRILSGTGAGQSRMIVSNTPQTLTLYSAWNVTPDATSDYQVINGGDPMHIHCATWVPQSSNGESNLLFVSFGDGSSGHVCRIPSFDQLPAGTNGEDYSGWGWNYSDAQVFAVRHQPTAMWAPGTGQLYFLARDYDGGVLATPDDLFSPQSMFEDWFSPFNSPYASVNFDAFAGSNGVAVVANLTEGAVAQYGIYVGDPTSPQQLFRYVRGYNASPSYYVGYYITFGNPQWDTVVVSGDSFGRGSLTNTWILHLPSLTNVQAILVGNATTNLIPNADFLGNSGSCPTNWSRSGSVPANSAVHNTNNAYGGGLAWQTTQTNTSAVTDFVINPNLSGFPSNQRLCVSFPYRWVDLPTSSYTAPAALNINWRSPGNSIRNDSMNGIYTQTAGQWHVAHLSALPPTNASEAQFQLEFRSFTGSVEIAMPSASWSRYALPANGSRGADVLEYASVATDWNGYLNSHVEFLVLPLWPTDVDPYVRETICSLRSSDGSRCLLTWSYQDGFEAVLEDVGGQPLLSLQLGQLHTLTHFDPCRFSIDFNHGVLTAKLDAGADVLQANGTTTAINQFQPVRIRLGSDLFSDGNVGWEGYYTLLAVSASN